MQKERFKDIKGYKGHYQISTFGNIKSLKYGKEKILKTKIDPHGYLRVRLSVNNKIKEIRIHRLVGMTFFNNYDYTKYGLVIDHIDNNKLNNNLTNLQIITHRENGSKDQFRHNRSSIYPGVCLHKTSGLWFSRILINGERKFLGSFKNEYNAHLAYQKELTKIN